MGSQVRTNFEAAAKKKNWPEAYANFRILNMSEMCRGLYSLGVVLRQEFWNERMTNLNFPVELPRWEYAFTVAHLHVLPKDLFDPNATDQRNEAQKFLSDFFPKGVGTLEKNLGYSMQAVNYVLTKNHVQGANWDKYRGEPSYERGTKAKDSVDICLYDHVRPESDKEIADEEKKRSLTQLDRMRIIADYAKRNGCGNCGENSILAFIFLYDMGVRPIDWMEVDRDHQFVVIGRKAGVAGDYKKWGSNAVLCDPWAQGFRRGNISIGTYSATQFEARMIGLVGEFTVFSNHREA